MLQVDDSSRFRFCLHAVLFRNLYFDLLHCVQHHALDLTKEIGNETIAACIGNRYPMSIDVFDLVPSVERGTSTGQVVRFTLGRAWQITQPPLTQKRPLQRHRSLNPVKRFALCSCVGSPVQWIGFSRNRDTAADNAATIFYVIYLS